MLNRHDPGKVLRRLADTMDVQKTLESFPGLTREKLSDILRSAGFRNTHPPSKAVLYVDGAARGNPGPAGAGFVLETEDGSARRFGEYLGRSTNNAAEYRALLAGLRKAAEAGVDELQVRCDSELVVKQLNGQYKVKKPHLQELYFSVMKEAASLGKVTFTHIPREENREADKMANMAIDSKGDVSL